MGLRVGIDLVSVRSVEESLAEHGEHYLRRVYTPGEIEECRRDGTPQAERLAARFAAKEAAMKVLEPNPRESCPWTSIEVLRAEGGAPVLTLHGPAESLADSLGIDELALSFSHEQGFACAVVVASVLQERARTSDHAQVSSNPAQEGR